MADATHLFKNMRMLLVSSKKGIVLPSSFVQEKGLPPDCNIAHIDHIADILKVQENGSKLEIAPGLTKRVINPSHFDKMKSQGATSLFSNKVSSAIKLLVTHNKLPISHLATAYFIDFMRRWFDLMSSRSVKLALSNINPDKASEAFSFLENSIHFFRSMRAGDGKWKPAQTGCILTTSAVLNLSRELLQEGQRYVLTSRFQSDVIENLFSCIRYKNPTPSCLDFTNNLRLISASQFLSNKKTGNYIEDGCTFLLPLESKKKKYENPYKNPENFDQDVAPKIWSDHDSSLFSSNLPLQNLPEFDEADKHILYCFLGYVIKSMTRVNSTCASCLEETKTSNPTADGLPFTLTIFRDYTGESLTYPSKKVYDMLTICEKLFLSFMNSNSSSPNLKVTLYNIFKPAIQSFSFKRCHEIKAKIINRYLTARLRLFTRSETVSLKEKKFNDGSMGSKSMEMRKRVKNIGSSSGPSTAKRPRTN